MERRKKRSALDNYIDNISEPPEKLKKTAEFYQSLKLFYRKKWNAHLRLPTVQGVEVNLFRLYDTVMTLGGYQKISQQEKWQDVAEMLGVGEDVLGGDYAVKMLYMRYLSKYEQVQTIGDIDDMMDEVSRGSRLRQTGYYASNENPMSFGRTVEYIRKDERGTASTDPDYGRLMKSLLCGLPNEIDFALNVCTLLSHPGPRLFRVSHAPHLLTMLVAQCGVFDDEDSLADLYPSWSEQGSRDFLAFWAASGASDEVLEKFAPAAIPRKPKDNDSDFFTAVAREYDVKDPMSWRITQVATIIRNLSFEVVNKVSMAECWPVMKFLLLCANTKYPPLYTTALDALGNLACDIHLSSRELSQATDHSLLKVIHDGLFSYDKFKLIRCLEILTGLCTFEGNEALIGEFLNRRIFDHIFQTIGVKDIMLCVYTLECLYQMSEMGDIACRYLAENPQAINQLVSMATLEAVSFGPAGLAGMKVVEYQPQALHPAYQQQQQMQAMGHPSQYPRQMPPQGAQGQPMAQVIRMPAAPPPGAPGGHHPGAHPAPGQHPAAYPAQISAQMHRAPQPQPMSQAMHPATPYPAHAGYPHHPPPPHHHPAATHMQNGQHTPQPAAAGPPPSASDNKLETLTEQWIRQNCVFDRTSVTPRGELYAAYVDDLRNQYHSLSVSLAMFGNVMKTVFPEVVSRMGDNGLYTVVQGIRLVKPHKLAPSAQVAPATSGATPSAAPQQPAQVVIVQGQTPASSVSNSHPLMKQILTKTPAAAPMKDSLPPPATITRCANDTIAAPAAQTSPVPRASKRTVTPQPSAATEGKDVKEETDKDSTDTPKSSEVKSEIAKKLIEDEAKVTTPEKETESKSPSKKSTPEEKKPTATAKRGVRTRPARGRGAASAKEAEEEEASKDSEDTKKEEAEEKKEEKATTSAKAAPVVETPKKAPPKPPMPRGELMCEWDGCGLEFASSAGILKHVSLDHVQDHVVQVCRWPGCDGTPRNKWSLVTHLQDHHCQERQLRVALQKRRDGLAPAKPLPYQPNLPREVPQHPGYSKHAAIEAIRRHAFNFLPRDITDEPEGPVTKSIRLTSCLILRNLARYSAEGRHQLRKHERHLCWLALSRLESSHALAQLLSALHADYGPPMGAPPTSASTASLTAVAANGGASSTASEAATGEGIVESVPASTTFPVPE